MNIYDIYDKMILRFDKAILAQLVDAVRPEEVYLTLKGSLLSFATKKADYEKQATELMKHQH